MATKVIPLETNEEDDDGWGQYIKIDIHEKPVSNLAYLTTSILEEENIQENKEKYCTENCIIC